MKKNWYLKHQNSEHSNKIVRGSGNLNFAIVADDAGIGKQAASYNGLPYFLEEHS